MLETLSEKKRQVKRGGNVSDIWHLYTRYTVVIKDSYERKLKKDSELQDL